jgi:hypothetical protein
MRTLCLVVLVVTGLGLASCAREDHNSPAARRAGRDAYKASQQIKKGAKEAAHELRDAGKEFKEGWSDAKQQDPKRK